MVMFASLRGLVLLSCPALLILIQDGRVGSKPQVVNRKGAPAKEKQVRLDRYGDPLSPGASARPGTVRLRHPGGYLLAFAADGKTLLSFGDQWLRVWDLATGKEMRRTQLGEKADTGYRELCACFSSDRTKLARVGEDGRTIVVWHVS